MSQTRTTKVRRVRALEQNNNECSLIEAASVLFGLIKGVAALSDSGVARSAIDTLQPAPTTAIPGLGTVLNITASTPVLQSHSPSATGPFSPITASSARSINEEFRSIVASAPFVTPASEPRIVELAHAVLAEPQVSEERTKRVQALRSFLSAEYQKIIATSAFSALTEALTEINFTPQVLKADSGYILARQGDDGPQIRVDVIKAPDGAVTIALDADCFKGTSCDEALGKLESLLQEKGIELEPASYRPKRRNQFAATHVRVRRGY